MTEPMLILANGMFALRTLVKGGETSRSLPEGPRAHDDIWGYKVRQLGFVPNGKGVYEIRAALTTEYTPPETGDLDTYRRNIVMGYVTSEGKEELLTAFNNLKTAPVISLKSEAEASLSSTDFGNEIAVDYYHEQMRNMSFVLCSVRQAALNSALKLAA